MAACSATSGWCRRRASNEELVDGGYARPDVKYQTALNRDQIDACGRTRGWLKHIRLSRVFGPTVIDDGPELTLA